MYATATYLASEVEYKNGQKVSEALDDLYNISSTYKNLNQTTTATANDILNGKTAYNSNGTLLTGTAVIGNGVIKNYSIPSNYTRKYL